MTTEASCCMRTDETSQLPAPHVPAPQASLTYATATAPRFQTSSTGENPQDLQQPLSASDSCLRTHSNRKTGRHQTQRLSVDPLDGCRHCCGIWVTDCGVPLLWDPDLLLSLLTALVPHSPPQLSLLTPLTKGTSNFSLHFQDLRGKAPHFM